MTDSPTVDLATRLEAAAAELSNRARAPMYENPFWMERYGERGLRYAKEDGLYHVTYLIESLRAGRSSSLLRYARWVRDLLVTRGMCTRHLVQNFELLAAEIARAEPDAGPATELLEEASRHLLRAEGPGAVLEAQGLAARLVPIAREAPDAHPHLGDDLICLASYLIDSVALDRADLFESHVRFLRDSYERRGLSPEPLVRALGVLGQALDALPDAERERPTKSLRAAEKLFAGLASCHRAGLSDQVESRRPAATTRPARHCEPGPARTRPGRRAPPRLREDEQGVDLARRRA